MFSLSRPGWTAANSAGMIAKYFATSLAMENVVNAPRVMRSCLPISTISMSLVGLESRSTMLPALLGGRRPGVHRHADVRLRSAGASFVPSPVIATSLPPACSRLMRAILSSGVASARSSTPASSAIALAVSGSVARDHDRLDAHAAQLLEPLAHAVLDDVLEVDDPQHAGSPVVLDRDQQRVPPAAEIRWATGVGVLGDRAAPLPDPGDDRGGGALADPSRRPRRRPTCGSAR